LTIFFGSVSTASDNPVGNFIRAVVTSVTGSSEQVSTVAEVTDSASSGPVEEPTEEPEPVVASCENGEVLVDNKNDTGKPGCLSPEIIEGKELEALEEVAKRTLGEDAQAIQIDGKKPIYVNDDGDFLINGDNSGELSENLLAYATGISGTIEGTGLYFEDSTQTQMSAGSWLPKLQVADTKLAWNHYGVFRQEHKIRGIFTSLETLSQWTVTEYHFVPPKNYRLNGQSLYFPYFSVPECVPGTFRIELEIIEDSKTLVSDEVPALKTRTSEPTNDCWLMNFYSGDFRAQNLEGGTKVEFDFTLELPNIKLGKNTQGYLLLLEREVTNPRRLRFPVDTLPRGTNAYTTKKFRERTRM